MTLLLAPFFVGKAGLNSSTVGPADIIAHLQHFRMNGLFANASVGLFGITDDTCCIDGFRVVSDSCFTGGICLTVRVCAAGGGCRAGGVRLADDMVASEERASRDKGLECV